MYALHLVSNPLALSSCLEVADSGDQILLIEDGVYAGKNAPRAVLVLAPDAEARGVGNRTSELTSSVDFDQFVSLVESHKPVVTWC